MKIIKSLFYYFFQIIFLSFIWIFSPVSLTYAQISEESAEQREFIDEDRRDRREQFEEILEQPKTAEEVVEYLRQRAKERMEEKRKKLLKKFKFTGGVTYAYESNGAANNLKKGDHWVEDAWGTHWIPTFNSQLNADIGWDLTDKNYFEQAGLGTVDHTIKASLKWQPFESGRLTLEPGFAQTWLIYPYDSSSTYSQAKPSLSLQHYLTNQWSWGGSYEYWYKSYWKKAARDITQANLDFNRQDYRNVEELWVKRQIGKYSLKLRGKIYRNNANDMYQNYYDHDSYHGYFTVAGSFLKNNKLYLSYTPDYEIKHYKSRVADDGQARTDKAVQHKLSAYYTLNKNFTAKFAYIFKKENSDANTGNYENHTTEFGITASF